MSDAKIIDGKKIAARLVDKISEATVRLKADTQVTPGLSVVLVGEDPASQVYVRNKGKMADKCGFKSEQHTLDKDTSEADLLSLIEDLNADPTVHGILVQLPLPDHIDETKVLRLIDPAKDVDGFHPVNVGLLHSGQTDQALVPCTPAGSILLAKEALDGSLSGLHAVVVGRSNIVGKPVAQLLLQENCTVTIAHSRTKNIEDVVHGADIVVAAVGRPEMIRGDWIKPGTVVIDVGINRVDAPDKGPGKTRLVGDVAYTEAATVAGAITPVPGGVGPMTIAMLMANTYTAACRLNDAQASHSLNLMATT
ncbi:MAG: bifunctional methylenetetrahydrofolate dehydrogenase/methenyltetrahydrofolate cyclohydrolase [Aquisalinus sp.]|nr:bifunctional methylenetetrahydrofolate dehydrogenase/methenyltetrahydrofolate cyclohydrolase [Aquisalinus sp.]